MNKREKYLKLALIKEKTNLKKYQMLKKYKNIDIVLKKFKEPIDIEVEKEKMKKNKVKYLCVFEKEYPRGIKNIYDPPIVIFYKGTLKNKFLFSVVGTRKNTKYGKEVINRIVPGLVNENIGIVSGMAEGIDTLAHLKTLKENGYTIAVLAHGLDMCYPKRNKILKKIIERKGLIISEYKLGTSPKRYYFPRRNRIISAISEGVLVVEAKNKSGSLITANYALEQGKEIFAIPARIDDVKSIGANNLIKMGANLVLNPKDILDVLKYKISKHLQIL